MVRGKPKVERGKRIGSTERKRSLGKRESEIKGYLAARRDAVRWDGMGCGRRESKAEGEKARLKQKQTGVELVGWDWLLLWR